VKRILLGLAMLSIPLNACVLDKIENKLVNNRVTTYTRDKVKAHPGKAGMLVGGIIGSVVTVYVVPKVVNGIKSIYNWIRGNK